MVPVEAQSLWIYAGVFWSKGGATLLRYDKTGNGALIDDNISPQKIEIGLVRSPGCSIGRKMLSQLK
jgi:hypothetical protein